MPIAVENKSYVMPWMVLGSGAYTVVAYLVWLAWDQEKTRVPGTSDWEGPYESWQVAGLALSLAALTVVVAWRRTSWGVACAATVVVALSVAWSVDAASEKTGAGLWPVGAVLLFLGSAVGLTLVVAVTVALREVTRRSARYLPYRDR